MRVAEGRRRKTWIEQKESAISSSPVYWTNIWDFILSFPRSLGLSHNLPVGVRSGTWRTRGPLGISSSGPSQYSVRP